MHAQARRGQGATEYLVLLAIVLVICLVSISLLNFFPGFSFETRMTESQYYWKTAKPLQILDHRQDPGSGVLSLVVNNGQTEQLQITDITVTGNGATGSNNSSIYLSGGETEIVKVTLDQNTCIDSGRYEYDIILSYRSQDGTLIGKEFGEKKLVGECSGVPGSGVGNGGNGGIGGNPPGEGGEGEPPPAPTCGLQGMICCPPGGTCDTGLVCRVGGCEVCGDFMQTCCNNNACNDGNFCLFGTCI